MKKAIKLDKASALYFDKNKDSNKIAVAKEEGEHNAKVETAKNMLSKCLDIELVSQCTDLTVEEVKSLL